jgi:2-polyprenyl-3-methyl-5-hydroxy-6-metoxy-1,4-benzoquinol methylase
MIGFLKTLFRNKVSLDRKSDLSEKFSEIYSKNIFGGKESRSGEGSNLVQTTEIRRELPKLLKEFGIKTFLDAPCGDWFWMRETALGVEKYTGVDIVNSLIEKNQQQFGNDTINFVSLNLVEDPLPQSDLIFCRDCLVHLTYCDIQTIVKNFKNSKSTYLLTTTFTNRTDNADLIGNDIWRPLNLVLPPFNFPKPLKLIDEKCTEYNGMFADKHLGLWLLKDIN